MFKRELDMCYDEQSMMTPSSSAARFEQTITGVGGGGAGVATAGERVRLDSIGSTSSYGATAANASSATVDERYSAANRAKRALQRLKRQHHRNPPLAKWMRQANVNYSDDGKSWDWDMVIVLLREFSALRILQRPDDAVFSFLRALVKFYKPSSNRFSHQDLGHGRHIPAFVLAGQQLVDLLLEANTLMTIRLLTDLFTDIYAQLSAITTSRSAHDCLFSPQHMSSTMCQLYFMYIGRMCRTPGGIHILVNTTVFKQ